jgi:glutamate formiminotransferase / formiminotetrahydrofolate cyclodeaminase
VTPFECVPNFSEGRDAVRIASIVDAGRGVAGVTVLDVESNPDHHRSVVSLYGEGDALVESVFRMVARATEQIDLNHHRGEHPRMGATDVVPFVPLEPSTMAEAVRVAERLGERVGRELAIPVFLYANAARRPERTDLAKVREGQFEGLRSQIGSDPARAPDFGPARIHPTAGAIAIGARPVLIAYNVYLSTPDVGIAKRIARTVRARDGGLPEVKALGFEIEERHLAQVSMNLTDYRVTPVHRAYDAVQGAAEKAGVGVEESEIVGLVPEDALLGAAEHYLQLKGFDRATILERKVRAAERSVPGSESIAEFGARLAARTPTPGGGSASAVAAALGTALGEMVLAYSIDPAAPGHPLAELRSNLPAARRTFLELSEADSAAYEAVRAARRLRKERAGDPTVEERYRAALTRAADVPLETARSAKELADRFSAAGPSTKPALASDLTTAIALLAAAREGALANVAANLPDLRAAGVSTDRWTEAIDRLRPPG